jgi:hypothetical protein
MPHKDMVIQLIEDTKVLCKNGKVIIPTSIRRRAVKWYHHAKPNATLMYSKIMRFPSPKGVLTLADHNWKTTSTRQFYGHSYSAPTPTITALQHLGLTITKAFALYIHYATKKLHDHSFPTPPPHAHDPPSFGHQVGF